MIRQEIIIEARSYIQTPFHLQGRVKGVGVDCVGLIVGLCQVFNIPHEDCRTYDHNAKGADLLEYFRKWFIEVPIQSPDWLKEGDIVALWTRDKDKPCHAGILTDKGIIHTHMGIDKVCEHRLGEWGRHISACFKLPGVED